MDYPDFHIVKAAAEIFPQDQVFDRFSKPFREVFDARAIINRSYENLRYQTQDPIIDGVIIGKAKGRYQVGNDLLGLTLIELGHQRFVSPFYFDSRNLRGFVDQNVASEVNADSFRELDLDDLIEEVRESEKIISGDFFKLGGTFVATGIFCGFLLDYSSLGKLIEGITGLPEVVQTGIIASLVSVVENHKEYRTAYDTAYADIAMWATPPI